ncbi:unnamed protein product [Urochloa humidicola]
MPDWRSTQASEPPPTANTLVGSNSPYSPSAWQATLGSLVLHDAVSVEKTRRSYRTPAIDAVDSPLRDDDGAGVEADRVGSREEEERRRPRAGPVDEDVGELKLTVALGEEDAHEEEGAVGAGDAGGAGRCGGGGGARRRRRQVGAVEDAAGEAGRVDEDEGHLDGEAGARRCMGGGLVLAAADLSYGVEEDPGWEVRGSVGGGRGFRHGGGRLGR